MRAPGGYVVRKKGSVTLLALEELAGELEEVGVLAGGDPTRWRGADGYREGGRGGSVRLGLPSGRRAVVKPLLRGGLMRLLNRSLHGSMARLVKEAELSSYLKGQGVPVAPMLFGRGEPAVLFFYRLHLASEEVPGAVTLLDVLSEGWSEQDRLRSMEEAGRSVRALHDAGVYHHDLNLGNLLWSTQGEGPGAGVRLIDLDRSCRLPVLSARARAANLARLFRHAVKRGLDRDGAFEAAWRRFLLGYSDFSDAGAARLKDAVESAYRRVLPLHRTAWALEKLARSRASTRGK